MLKPKLPKWIVISNELIQSRSFLSINKGRKGCVYLGLFLTTILSILSKGILSFSCCSETRTETFEYWLIFSIDDFSTWIPPSDLIPQALINILFTYKQF